MLYQCLCQMAFWAIAIGILTIVDTDAIDSLETSKRLLNILCTYFHSRYIGKGIFVLHYDHHHFTLVRYE